MSSPPRSTLSGHRRAVVVVGGGPLDTAGVAAADDSWLVVAADGGYDHALEAGLAPKVLIGDLDSISAAGLDHAHAHGTEIVGFPPDKDLTDTELALDLVADRGASDVLLLGGLGDRLDHLLGTIGALGRPSLDELSSVAAWLGPSRVLAVRPGRDVALDLTDGQTFSLLALHGEVTGAHLQGARWPLTDATLRAGSARGVSNVATGPCRLSCAAGVVTVVVP